MHMGTRVASFDLSADGSKVQGIVLADTESTKVCVSSACSTAQSASMQVGILRRAFVWSAKQCHAAGRFSLCSKRGAFCIVVLNLGLTCTSSPPTVFKVSATTVVNCAGPWFNKLNARSDIKTTTEMLPTRIHVGHKAGGRVWVVGYGYYIPVMLYVGSWWGEERCGRCPFTHSHTDAHAHVHAHTRGSFSRYVTPFSITPAGLGVPA